jgi:hypothetical protein
MFNLLEAVDCYEIMETREESVSTLPEWLLMIAAGVSISRPEYPRWRLPGDGDDGRSRGYAVAGTAIGASTTR